MIGRIVGNYKIIQALGEGGVGMVYKGVDTMLDREVAIKVLRPELASQTSVVERFRSEAVTLAKLSHPNIATLYSLFRDGNDLIMVLEFIKGETLDHTLYRSGKINTDEAIPIFCQALEGINYAHRLGIVHRDIKPGNMMLTEDGILKVLDFGIARLLGSNRMTRVGNVIGTLEYMSPEQVRGQETDARSDVYGMGIMLYEMLTGRLPFESENDFALMKMQTENEPTPPRQLNPDIPVEVENAIMKSVEKDPNQRFQSAGEFLEYFLEIGFSLPNNTFGFGTMYGRKISRPSNPGIKSGEVSNNVPIPIPNISAEVPLPTSKIEEPISIPVQPIQPSTSQFSKSEIPVTLEVGEEIKKQKIAETRLAQKQNEVKGTTPTNTPNQHELKATRLGEVQTVKNAESPSSFFTKLNWIHYTGAGAIGVFILTLVATAAVLPFVWGEGNKITPKVEQSPAPAVTPTIKTESSTAPIAQESPVSTPIRDNGGVSPIYASNNSNSDENLGNTITPVSPSEGGENRVPSTPKRQPKETKERVVVKDNPPPAPKPTPVHIKPTPPVDTGSKKKLRDILTDN